jgi:hypothetical protein
MPPKAEPKKGGKAAEAEPAVDVPKAMKDLRPRWEKLSAAVGVPLENKAFPRPRVALLDLDACSYSFRRLF